MANDFRVTMLMAGCVFLPRPGVHRCLLAAHQFPQGWPKFAQSVVLAEPAANPPAIVIASLVSFNATVAAAAASVAVDSAYPFGDTATITVTANKPTTLKVRIPGWASHATVDGKPAPNGTLVAVPCLVGKTTVVVDLKPKVRVERGWGDKLATPAANSVAVARGPLVFALHPKEKKTIKKMYNTTPASVVRTAFLATHPYCQYLCTCACACTAWCPCAAP